MSTGHDFAAEPAVPDFVESLGPAFLAHLLRRVSDQLVEADELWHARAGVANPPRTSSTLLALEARGAMSVMELATLLKQSHQLVIQWIRALLAQGLVATSRDPNDGRRTIVTLTDAGRESLPALHHTIRVAGAATRTMIDEIAPGLWEDLWRFERALRSEPFVNRIRQAALDARDTPSG